MRFQVNAISNVIHWFDVKNLLNANKIKFIKFSTPNTWHMYRYQDTTSRKRSGQCRFCCVFETYIKYKIELRTARRKVR